MPRTSTSASMVASEKRALRLTQTPKGCVSIDFREVRSILDAMDAPAIDEHVLFSFQKILHRGESGSSIRPRSDYPDLPPHLGVGRDQGALTEPFVSAVAGSLATEASI